MLDASREYTYSIGIQRITFHSISFLDLLMHKFINFSFKILSHLM